jgi:hypothetical protein
MTREEAIQHGLGYAAVYEDASGTRTASPTAEPGFMAFAYAYGDAWQAFNREERHTMPPAQTCYLVWQETKGKTIFP